MTGNEAIDAIVLARQIAHELVDLGPKRAATLERNCANVLAMAREIQRLQGMLGKIADAVATIYADDIEAEADSEDSTPALDRRLAEITEGSTAF